MDSYQSKLVTLLNFIITTSLFVGCAAKVHDFKATNALSLKFSQYQAGLKISVDPFFEEERLVKYFGDDLLSRGILPVFVIFENQNAEDGFILIQEQVTLLLKQQNYQNDKEQQLKHKQEFVNYNIAPSEGAYLASLLAGSIVGLFAMERHWSNIAIININMTEKKIVDKIVYPGCSHNGFLYFNLDDKKNVTFIEGILLPLKNIRTDAVLRIPINMK